MIPVMQTRYGHLKGNCLLACVAAILHRKIEEIPDFAMSGCGWFDDLYEWCMNEGIGLICLNPNDLNSSIVLNSFAIGIWTVINCATENHAVIMRCVREESGLPDAKDALANWTWIADIEYDPNPMRPERGSLEHLLFLLPQSGCKLRPAGEVEK